MSFVYHMYQATFHNNSC